MLFVVPEADISAYLQLILDYTDTLTRVGAEELMSGTNVWGVGT